MLSYRDRTYCSRNDCVNTQCPRKLTHKIMEDAKDFGLPVAHADFSDTCGMYITTREIYDNTEQTA